MRTLVLATAIIGVFAVVLPVSLPRTTSSPSDETCLRLMTRDDATQPPAVAIVQRCAALYPTDVELLAMLGGLYETSRKPEQALTTYRRALAIDPNDAELRLRVGRLLLTSGAAVAAAHEASLALAIQPNRRDLVTLLRDAQTKVRAAR